MIIVMLSCTILKNYFLKVWSQFNMHYWLCLIWVNKTREYLIWLCYICSEHKRQSTTSHCSLMKGSELWVFQGSELKEGEAGKHQFQHPSVVVRKTFSQLWLNIATNRNTKHCRNSWKVWTNISIHCFNAALQICQKFICAFPDTDSDGCLI